LNEVDNLVLSGVLVEDVKPTGADGALDARDEADDARHVSQEAEDIVAEVRLTKVSEAMGVGGEVRHRFVQQCDPQKVSSGANSYLMRVRTQTAIHPDAANLGSDPLGVEQSKGGRTEQFGPPP
jgi:hypothetical protein